MKKLGLYLLVAIFCFSCTKLNYEEYTVLDVNAFPKNEEDLNALMIASVYAPFKGIFYGDERSITSVGDVTTDLGDVNWVWPITKQDFVGGPSGDYVWSFYRYVGKMNTMTLTLDRINKVDLAEEVKTRMIAETKCGRAFMGYLMYDWFGPVPIVPLEIMEKPLEDIVVPRPTNMEMVAFIENNLKEAIPGLPARYNLGDANFGRFTRGLAYTLLMKLYMHEKRWGEAVEVGRELQKPEYGLGLMDNYKDIFTINNQGNKEIIWCNNRNSSSGQAWLAFVLSSQYPTNNKNIQKWSMYKVPWSFYNTFDPADKRLEVLVGEFLGLDGVLYNQANPGGYELGLGALPVKYGEDPNDLGTSSEIDLVVYRYADVITLLAEAIVREGNVITGEALALLNEVHTRAGLTAYQLSDFGGPEEFLSAILLERGHELWFEGARRTDLIRHGKYIEVGIVKGSVLTRPGFEVMPLPQTAIDEGRGEIIQNEAYR